MRIAERRMHECINSIDGVMSELYSPNQGDPSLDFQPKSVKPIRMLNDSFSRYTAGAKATQKELFNIINRIQPVCLMTALTNRMSQKSMRNGYQGHLNKDLNNRRRPYKN